MFSCILTHNRNHHHWLSTPLFISNHFSLGNLSLHFTLFIFNKRMGGEWLHEKCMLTIKNTFSKSEFLLFLKSPTNYRNVNFKDFWFILLKKIEELIGRTYHDTFLSEGVLFYEWKHYDVLNHIVKLTY